MTAAPGGTGGFTSGAGPGGRRPTAYCPAEQPPADTPCSGTSGHPCEYETTAKSCCTEAVIATCVAGSWEVSEIDCDCPPPGSGGTGGATAGFPDSWFSCTHHEECQVAPVSCCGNCGRYASNDAMGIRGDSLDGYQRAYCPGVDCAACAEAPTYPSMVPVCRDGRCQVEDLSQTPITACVADEDCRLGYVYCCECGTPPDPAIAITTGAEVHSIVCEGGGGLRLLRGGWPRGTRVLRFRVVCGRAVRGARTK